LSGVDLVALSNDESDLEPGPPPESTDLPPTLPVTPNCERVEGDCDIYSDTFWELLARYERFEIDVGVYPMPPECMEAEAEGRPVVCIQVVTFLYPDGTLGGQAWVIDPEAPGGWRFWEPPEEEAEEVVDRRCELVTGDCSIYSDTFWELLARYERFEIDVGVYPMPPECMEAAEGGGAILCAQVISYLYPDGTTGSASWVVDPCAPDGWRFWEPNPPSC